MHMHLQKLAEAGLVDSETKVADDGKAHRYYNVTDFVWTIEPASIAEAVQSLTKGRGGRKGQDGSSEV